MRYRRMLCPGITTKQLSRKLLFNSICIPSRIGLIFLLFYYPLPEMSIILFLMALSFAYQYGKNKRVGFFGGKVYWYRSIHALCYFTAGTLLLFEETRKYAYASLIADVIFGYLSFIINF